MPEWHSWWINLINCIKYTKTRISWGGKILQDILLFWINLLNNAYLSHPNWLVSFSAIYKTFTYMNLNIDYIVLIFIYHTFYNTWRDLSKFGWKVPVDFKDIGIPVYVK